LPPFNTPVNQLKVSHFIQGVYASKLLEEFGSPLYVYDAQNIKHQYQLFENAIKVKNLSINYACKALSNINVLKLLKSLGSGLDTVSIQEVQLGILAGFNPHNILFTPNSVSIDEIEKAIQLGVRINIDNIETLEHLGHKYPEYPFGIRINPHIMAGGNSKIAVGHIDSKFGISIHQLPLVKRITESLNMHIEGIHMHTGSDILDIDVFLFAADILFRSALEFRDLKYIDFGSGFKVKYKPDDIETDIEKFGFEITKRFNTFCEEYGKPLQLMFEPGKYLVSEAGYFLAKVNVVKQTTSTVFIGIDSGFNHLIRPMFYNAHHHIENISNPNGEPKIYTIVGYICETDTFAWNRKMNETRKGDILCFHNAGAYCFSMTSNYNSRFRPAEVLIHNQKPYLIRKREGMEDLTRNIVHAEIKDWD
jgi:diaminopimelate decarboxylase